MSEEKAPYITSKQDDQAKSDLEQRMADAPVTALSDKDAEALRDVLEVALARALAQAHLTGDAEAVADIERGIALLRVKMKRPQFYH